jgi:hypothetical protein
MIRKTNETISRADRVLIAALAIILATASAAVGSSFTYGPHTDQIRVIKVDKPVLRLVHAPVIPAAITVRGTASDVVLAGLLAEHRCLSEVMYFEARGEGEEGQKAVAEVIFHRMNKGNYGHSICAVVYEGVGSATCQFSFVCDGSLEARKSPEPWREAEALAARILTGEERLNDATGGAVNFHAASIEPGWTGEFERTVQIGNHIFYRRPGHARLNGA